MTLDGFTEILVKRNTSCRINNFHSKCHTEFPCLEIIVATGKNRSCDVMVGDECGYRLKQNEYSYVTELIRCSYHPKECACEQKILSQQGEQNLSEFRVILVYKNTNHC